MFAKDITVGQLFTIPMTARVTAVRYDGGPSVVIEYDVPERDSFVGGGTLIKSSLSTIIPVSAS